MTKGRLLGFSSKHNNKTFSLMIVPVYAQNLFLSSLCGNAKKVNFVIKRYAIRNAKIRPHAGLK